MFAKLLKIRTELYRDGNRDVRFYSSENVDVGLFDLGGVLFHVGRNAVDV